MTDQEAFEPKRVVILCQTMIALTDARCVKPMEDSKMDSEFKKDGDPSRNRVMDMMKEIQENDFKGKSRGSITIRDEKSDLKDIYNLEEKSDGTEKETLEEKVILLEKNQKNIPKPNDGLKRDSSPDKRWGKNWCDRQNGQRRKSSDAVTQTRTPVEQDNRFASAPVCIHGDPRQEEETPVKELMFVAVENEHTFDSVQSDTSVCSLGFGVGKSEEDQNKTDPDKADPDKDDDETEKSDETKPELYENLPSLHVESLNEDHPFPPLKFNMDKNCPMSQQHSANFDTMAEVDADKDTVCSNFIMDKNGKMILDSFDLDSLSSEFLGVDVEQEVDQRQFSLDKNGKSLQSADLDTSFELSEVNMEQDEFVKEKMDLNLEKKLEAFEEDMEDGCECTEFGLDVDLQTFSQKSSMQWGVCGRELKDITNLLLKTRNALQECTEVLEGMAGVSSLKGDNSFISLDKQFCNAKELTELTSLVNSSSWLTTVSDLQMDKGPRVQETDRQAITFETKARKKLNKKVKQLEVLCLEMWNWNSPLRKATDQIAPPRIATNKKFLPRDAAYQNVHFKKGRRMPGLLIEELLPKKHCSGLPPGGGWTPQGFKCKGDNLKKQPSDSGNGCQGNGFQGCSGNQKSSRDGNGNKEGGNKETTRNFDDEKDIDEQEHPPEDNNNEASNAEGPTNTTAPSSNYKYRKKENMETYKKLVELKEDIPPDIMKEIGVCLVACLNSKKIGGSDVVSDCSICAFLFSIISHFGNCPSDYNSCDMCQRAFCLVSKHLQLCMECGITEVEPACPLPICKKIQNKFKMHPEKISQRGKELWPKLKKYLARFSRGPEDVGQDIPLDEGDDYFSLSSIQLGSLSSVGSSSMGGLPRSSRPSRTSVVFEPTLESISENMSARRLTGSRSEPFARKTESGEIIYSKEISTRLTRPSRLSIADENKFSYPSQHSRSAPLARKAEEGKTVYLQDPATLPKPLRPAERKVSFKVDIPAAIKSLPSLEEPLTSIAEVEQQYASLNQEKVYGADRMSSLPLNFYPPNMVGDQLTSVQMRPLGYPGIGEVVYAYKENLRYVARHWKNVKEDYQRDRTFEKKHLREEGVVLTENKEKFSIFRTRYQKNFQWIRLTHLGTGMSGKCHLAQDYNTDFKFCIKKIHILKFDERELDIWSDLSHQNIVRLYGAIRHGHNIYIFEEFIDGGCLTETINLQKETGHRLSHWTALNYLQQILQVLVYLEKRSIIHEDIKADNILLRKDTRNVVVADFGVARRKEHVLREASPVGTPTSFSPEKVKGEGHGSRSDVWAAVCVLIHMLSGAPPWVRRFKDKVATLNFIIAEREPPLEDLPANVSRDVYNLVEHALKKDPKARPSASKVLQHKAFKLLAGGSTPDTFVSVLESPLNTDIKISDDIDKALIAEVNGQYRSSQSALPWLPSSQITVMMTTGSTASPQNTATSRSDPSQTGNDMTETGHGAAAQRPRSELPPLGSNGIGEEILTSVGMVTPRHPPILPHTRRDSLPGYQGDVKDLKVMGPPTPAKYIDTDPEVFFRQYVNDCDVAVKDLVAGEYKKFLEAYEPDPANDSNSGDEDIEKVLDRLNSFTNIPDLDKLLDSVMPDDHRQGPASIPDVVHQMIDDALRQNMRDASGEPSYSRDETGYRTTGGIRPASYGSLPEEEEEEEVQEEVQELPHVRSRDTDDKFIPNFGSLLNDNQSSQNTNSNNANFPNLPTILNSMEDVPTLTSQKSSSSSGNSLQEHGASSEEGRKHDFSLNSSTEEIIISEEDSSSNRAGPVPTDTVQEMSSEVPFNQNSVMPNLDMLMASMAFIEEENNSIPMDCLFGSGDEETSETHTPIKGEGQRQGHCNTEKFVPKIPAEVQGQLRDDTTPTEAAKQFPVQSNDLSGQIMPSFTPLIITDKNTGAITKTKVARPQPVNVAVAGRIQMESDDQSLSPIKSRSPLLSPMTSTPLNSPPYSKHNKKHLYLNLSPSKRKTDRQTSEPQQRSTQFKSPNPREVKPYFTPQKQMTSPPSWRGASTTPPKGSGASSDSKLEQQTRENETKIAEYLEEMSRHSENSKSQIDDLDYMSDQEVEDISVANDDEEEFQASLMRIQQDYVSQEVKESHSYGALVRVVTSEKELFNIKLVGEHVLNTWEVVIDKELSEKLTGVDISNFILVDKNGDPLDLTESPTRGEQTVQVREPDDDSPWSCRDTIIQKASFF